MIFRYRPNRSGIGKWVGFLFRSSLCGTRTQSVLVCIPTRSVGTRRKPIPFLSFSRLAICNSLPKMLFFSGKRMAQPSGMHRNRSCVPQKRRQGLRPLPKQRMHKMATKKRSRTVWRVTKGSGRKTIITRTRPGTSRNSNRTRRFLGKQNGKPCLRGESAIEKYAKAPGLQGRAASNPKSSSWSFPDGN